MNFYRDERFRDTDSSLLYLEYMNITCTILSIYEKEIHARLA